MQLRYDITNLLKLFHIKQFERFLRLQEAIWQFEDVVADCIFFDGVFDVDGRFAKPLDQNVACLIHLDFTSLANLSLELFRFGVPHGIFKSVHTDSIDEKKKD